MLGLNQHQNKSKVSVFFKMDHFLYHILVVGDTVCKDIYNGILYYGKIIHGGMK